MGAFFVGDWSATIGWMERCRSLRCMLALTANRCQLGERFYLNSPAFILRKI